MVYNYVIKYGKIYKEFIISLGVLNKPITTNNTEASSKVPYDEIRELTHCEAEYGYIISASKTMAIEIAKEYWVKSITQANDEINKQMGYIKEANLFLNDNDKLFN